MHEPINAIKAINKWTKQMCTIEKLKMGPYLTEEINGNVTRFIKYMLEESTKCADIWSKIPSEITCITKIHNALSQTEFNTIVSYIHPGIALDSTILIMLHNTTECYIYKLIHEGCQLSRINGSKVLTISDVNTIRLKYFPVKVNKDEPNFSGFFDLVMTKKIKTKTLKTNIKTKKKKNKKLN